MSGAATRRGASSVMYSAVATAIGTPMTSPSAAVMIEPATSGQAPKSALDGLQSLVNRNEKTPWWLSAGWALLTRKTKKNAISARIRPARPVRIQRNSGSARRADGDRSRIERSPGRTSGVVAAISSRSRQSLGDRGAVALHRVDGGLALGLEAVGDRRVGQLLDGVLALPEEVADHRLQTRGLVLAQARLARVLVGDGERLGDDRVGGRVGRVDRRDAEVGGHVDALTGGRGRLERRGDELAALVLDVGEREAVLQRVGLLDVADGAIGRLDRGGDAVVALGAGARRPLDVLVDGRARLPLRRVVGQELCEALRRARRVRAVHDGDLRRGDRRAAVERLDRRVVPALDLAQVDVGQRLAVELEAALDAVEVVGGRDRAQRERHLDRLALLDRRAVVGGQRRIGAGEVGRAGGELRDAGARADALVVDGQALALEVVADLLVDRRGERRAGAVERRLDRRPAVAAGRGRGVVAAAAGGEAGGHDAGRGSGQQGTVQHVSALLDRCDTGRLT